MANSLPSRKKTDFGRKLRLWHDKKAEVKGMLGIFLPGQKLTKKGQFLARQENPQHALKPQQHQL
ncbi:MAG: hypothetical protein J0M29_12210 [Chitinophagales bacterium]|nr:hypothetical protein [Chitinophagales bacterium]